MKEKNCLITTSLLSSISWFLTAPNIVISEERGGDGKTTWKEKAELDLKKLLSREKDSFPIEAQRGVKFEKQVYKWANNINNIPKTYSENFINVCKEVEGFQFFKKGGLKIKVNNDICYLYGKYDAYKLNCLKDIKTTKEYKQNKYLNTSQHLIYCYITKINYFEYIIVEWKEYPEIKNIYKEIYMVNDWKELEDEIINLLTESINFLKDYQLWDLYKEKFCLY
jgi:hypothetical protein